MGDKGFLLKAEFQESGILFYQPSFLNCEKPQFDIDEVQWSEVVSKVRVHVERIIQRVRNYHILRGNIPLSLKPLLEQIFTVCAFLTNFQTPIVH